MMDPQNSTIDRRRFVTASAAGMGGLLLGGLPRSVIHVKGREQRPNILWLIAEDLCPDLGCYGGQNTEYRSAGP